MNIDQVDRAVQERMARASAPAHPAIRRDAAVPAAPSAQQTAAREAADRAASEQLRRAMAEASRRLAQKASELTFEFDEDTRRVIVKLVDTRTREVLRQIPSEEALAIARALQDDVTAGALLRAEA
ncbi:MAG: flagellar protein FlaG [Burkholderiaceae bacterium]